MKLKRVQSNFLSGVLDPRALARVDAEAYTNGLLVGTNVIPEHLGGVKRRPGTRFLQRLSYKLVLEEPEEITTPEGDTDTVPANANDDDLDTYVEGFNIGTTNPFVVVRYDLGENKLIRHVDVRRISLSAGSSSQFVIQFSVNDSFWVSVGEMLVDDTERSYRFTPNTVARYWRVARVGSINLGSATVALAEFNVWTETDEVSRVRLIPFELGTTEQYLVALTDRSGFIYQDGTLIPNGYFPTPYSSDELTGVDAAVGAGSLFFVHEEHAPRFLIKQPTGLVASNEFQSDDVSFASVPQYDFNDNDSPAPTSEIQVITFSAGWIAGDSFQIELDGARSGSVAYAGDSSAAEQTATAQNIARAIQKLYTVLGFEGVSCVRTGTLAYTVTFAGSSAKPYGLMTVLPLITDGTATATASVVRSQAGVSRHEDVWSATRGYPRTATFFEGRLYFGGTRDLPQSLFGSTVNNVTDFEILEGLDADPIFVTLNGHQLNAITGLFSGRSLEVFTTGGEFRYVKQPGQPVTPLDAPKNQTQYGAAKIRPVAIDGATIFVQRTRKSVRDFKFDFNEDAYSSLGLSSLAPHLINDVQDVAAWNGSRTDEINLVFVVNVDGTMAVLNMRREAEVNAWTRWVTGPNAVEDEFGVVTGQDKIRAVAALSDDVYFAVDRNIGGVDVLYLEVMDDEMYVDAGVLKRYNQFGVGADYTVSFISTDPLIGSVCRVTVDGLVVDNIIPEVGEVEVLMPESYEVDDTNTEIRIGLNFNPRVTPMPLMSQGPSGQSLIKKQRVVKVKVKVRNTLGLLLNGDRILADRYYDISNFDEPLTPYNGNLVLEETSNWDDTEDKTVTFTQVDPLPMEILGYEVVLESAE